MRFDVDSFVERRAIMEFDGGMSRFKAETEAARLQGVERWQAMKLTKEAIDAHGERHLAGGGDTDAALARERGPMPMPGMQPAPEEENGPMPEHHPDAGRAGLELPPLRP